MNQSSVPARSGYRVSDFARYLGVTPDLLKHYEEVGLITPVRTNAGYRIYPFWDAPILMECARLRNYGFTLKEIRDLLNPEEGSRASDAPQDSLDVLSEKAAVLERSAAKKTVLVEDYRRLRCFAETLEGKEGDWEIRRSREALFLPHSQGRAFLEDPAIYELIRPWMDAFPIVRSTLQVKEGEMPVWGLSIETDDAVRLGLPVNDVCERLPARKCFFYYFRAEVPSATLEAAPDENHPVFTCLKRLNLAPAGPWYRTLLMPCDFGHRLRAQYGFYAIPIE